MTGLAAQSTASLGTAPGRLLVKDGWLIDPASGIDGRIDLLIEAGRVQIVEAEIEATGSMSVIDASGLTVAPGLVDLHCHLREPGAGNSETIESGTRAAAAGGFTTICAMPGTKPVCDSPVAVRYVIDRARQTGSVRVLPIAAVTQGQDGAQLTEFAALRTAGAVGVGDAMHCVADAQVLRRAMEYARPLGLPIFDHAEDPDLAHGGLMHEGEVSVRLGLRGIPRSAESSVVARDAQLALETGARVHFCHLSNAESVEVLRFYRARGANLTADVTPHHLTLTDESVAGKGLEQRRYDTNVKVKPPLCEESDRQALIAALEDGTIDCIATDHAPHYPASKDTLFDGAPFGIIGFESTVPLLVDSFVASGRWTARELLLRLTSAPARVLGMPLASLAPGMPADLVLLDLERRFEFDDSSLRSKSRNCPWLGRELQGAVVGTLSRGIEAHADSSAFPQGLTGPRAH